MYVIESEHDDSVVVYIKYLRLEDSTKALIDLSQRYYGGRKIAAEFIDEETFEKETEQ